ncbi:MAG: bifunctional demethylmenaquinone methyltransferase/2-methoxy-6-polyprenyl-1,4-benzoquinol methylase UbiE [Paludibacter sp.]|jgi:demethylmenaquinone methyltransferase/2-methoxy-6-polyprenyl-1,4-benzoquinol methylase|nr:bifunctional demethylmenaquinone methyltransferase/2-methoxy-6-polyprenyl-1,4-benzoquinol methylase UbiE [Paludibacter sp.]
MEDREVLNDAVKPYNKEVDKTSQLRDMFNTISQDYDFFNNLMSWGLAHRWRRKAMAWLQPYEHNHLLDIATGTADMIVLAEKLLQPQTMIGVDIAEDMLKIGRKKLEEHHLSTKAVLETGDCAALPYDNERFDLVTISFGLRNLEKLSQSLHEIHRVLKPGGHFLIIEVNEPQQGLLAVLYRLYVRIYVLFAAQLLSKDKDAYKYLTQSMHVFPQGKALIDILKAMDFKLLKTTSFTFGVCSAYLLEKVD